jgi:hypothetical protein
MANEYSLRQTPGYEVVDAFIEHTKGSGYRISE